MKRSAKLSSLSRQTLCQALVSLALSVAIVCWVPMAVLSGDSHPGGMSVPVAVGALALALCALTTGYVLLLESLRLARMAKSEARYEWERSIRPRL